MIAFQSWPAILPAGSSLVYVELLRRLNATATELRQTTLLNALTSLADSVSVAVQEQATLPLLQKWQRLLQAICNATLCHDVYVLGISCIICNWTPILTCCNVLQGKKYVIGVHLQMMQDMPST